MIIMRIRHMTAEDAEAVSRLVIGSWVETYGPLIGTEKARTFAEARYTPDRILTDLRRAHSETFVAETDGMVAGYAYGMVSKGILWLDRLHVARIHRGQGLGAALLHAVIVNYVGEPAISLEVIKANTRAVDFYTRQGFAVAEERDACGGIAGVPTLVMRKPMPRA
ncbi:MAG: GNAT family N-acetyltransferase [Rhizobiaceae bacterium]|nr:GNAT family N-acetyltransferase [Rhizobiaceae bacterium]MCV0408625.1 GNAT family N-acetyltransferase [Rhizobiaceae bacterium]